MPATQFDPKRVALAKTMVYMHFGFQIPNGMDILSRTGTPLGAGHVAGSLNQIGTNWLPVATQGRYRLSPLLTVQKVFNKTPAGELMRLCYDHIVEVMQVAQVADFGTDAGDTIDFDGADLSEAVTGDLREQTLAMISPLQGGD